MCVPEPDPALGRCFKQGRRWGKRWWEESSKEFKESRIIYYRLLRTYMQRALPGNQIATGAGGGKFVLPMPRPAISAAQQVNNASLQKPISHEAGGNATFVQTVPERGCMMGNPHMPAGPLGSDCMWEAKGTRPAHSAAATTLAAVLHLHQT